MLDSRIISYLLQFYLFAAGGALSYLSLRAWLDPALSRRRREERYHVSRWTHLLRGLGLLAIAIAAIVGALKEGASDAGLSADALLRCGGYVLFLTTLPRVFLRRTDVWVGITLIAIGEVLIYIHSGHQQRQQTGTFLALLYAHSGMALSDIGFGIVGARMVRTILSIRLVDRLVISFTLFGLVLAQIVAFLVVGMLSSFSADTTQVLGGVEHPLLMTLTSVLIVSALIGYIFARDLSQPVSRLGAAVRAIGDGNLGYRVESAPGLVDDEMHDLMTDVNRMASQLKAVDELRSDFFSFVSHELRTPLTSIKGFVATLESADGFSPDERAEMYGIVHSETDRLLRMINELLDLSRVQAGKPLKLNMEWFDVGRNLAKAAGVLNTDDQLHPIVLRMPKEPLWIYADPDKVQQIALNLMSNAIKYSPGGGTVTVDLTGDESRIRFSVTDQGVGMTAEQCEHVFDKFYRVAEQEGEGANRLRRVEGAGIGLYLTHALVEAHSGQIEVSSEQGEGSVFTVTLPRQTADAPENHKTRGPDVSRPLVLRSGARRDGRSALLSADERRDVPHLIAQPDNGLDGEQNSLKADSARPEALPL